MMVATPEQATLEGSNDLIVAFHWADDRDKHCEVYQDTSLRAATEAFLKKHKGLAVPFSFEVRADRP